MASGSGGKDYKLEIKIGGEVEKSLDNAILYTKRQMETMEKDWNIALNSMEPAFGGLESAAKTTLKAVVAGATAATAAVAMIGTAAATAGIEYESAFAGIKKTTDATAYEYRQLSSQILDMADNIPAAAAEIAEVAENAGQLGIAKDYLLEFSNVMMGLGEATDLSATEAATSFAKIANITDMSADYYSNLGSVVVALGNNFATTESEIVEMGTRLAATGDLAGLSQAQMMAVSTAISSVGIEAEAGGSAFSKFLKDAQLAVELSNEQLTSYASVANMTSEEFQKAFKEDAVAALGSFLNGLNDTERNGKSAIAILDEMGLTEVRLSNMVLSLANANGVLTNSIDTANKAWDENTALTNEVAQRYATTESQIEIMKNRVTGIGIDMYEDFRDPMRDIIAEVNTVLGEIGNEVERSDFIENLVSEIPTLRREIMETTDAILDFADPFISVGEFLIENNEILVGTVVGIGGALATYKVEKGIAGLAGSIAKLGTVLTNPLALGLSGVAIAIGGAAGIAAAVKKANAEMKKQNLAEHFGDISLSLSDLEEAATRVIQTDSLSKLTDIMSSYDEIEGFSASIDKAVREVNKANWKVSIGMELDETDRDEYKANIESFINDTQQALAEGQYAMSLNLELFTSNDATGNAIKEKFNAFYQSQSAELQELGTKLSETVNEAFSDDLLSIDEAKEIAELQSQMAAITEKMAASRFDAKMEVLGMEYGGGDLDAESFQNLQTEINEQVETYKASLQESLEMNIANASVMLDEGSINKTEYDEMIAEFKESYLEQMGDIELKATSFQTDTIMKQYEDEISAAAPEIQSLISKVMAEYSSDGISQQFDNNAAQMLGSMVDYISDGNNLDSTTRAALAELYNSLQPNIERMEELKASYMEQGKEIPNSFVEGINEAQTIGAMANSESAIWALLGDAMTQSEEYQEIIANAKEQGNYIPETIASAMAENRAPIYEGSATLFRMVNEDLTMIFGAGIDLNVPVSVNYGISGSSLGISGSTQSSSQVPEVNYNVKTGHKDGGIFNIPHVAWFAEEGTEAAIPIDGSKNAINLWETTGQLLGVFPNSNARDLSLDGITNGNSVVNNSTANSSMGAITYNPTYQFYGAAPSQEELQKAERSAQEEFAKLMEDYIRNNRRLIFQQ